MNRVFILVAGIISAILILASVAGVGLRSIEKVRLRHEAQFREGLTLELAMVTKALRNDLVFGNLRVVRGSLAELSDGGVFSGFSVRREGLVVLDSNVPPDAASSFVTTVPVAFAQANGTDSMWGEVVYYTPRSRFDAVSAGLKEELSFSVAVAVLVTLAVVGSLFLLLSRSVGLLAPKLTSVALQEELPPSNRLTRFIWGPALIQLEALASKLVARRQEAEQARAAAMHTRIAQNLVHDLRTPLGSFERGLEVRDWSSFEKERLLMRRALARLHAMVEALRHSELERLVRPEPTCLSFLQLIDELIPFASERQVALQGSAEAFSCTVDQPKVERAVLNLLRNGIEAARTTVTLSLAKSGRDLTLVVEDDGDGVPADLQGRLFQRGWTHSKVGGSGLGLAYARDVARGHGGDLTFHRIDGRTQFVMDLPDVLANAEAERPESPLPETQRASQPDVLLALLDSELFLPRVRCAWQGTVLTNVSPGLMQVAAVYVHASRFDEVAEQLPEGVPVAFAKDNDDPTQVVLQLAKRAKKGPT
jgi:signal transduction histidine kinase